MSNAATAERSASKTAKTEKADPPVSDAKVAEQPERKIEQLQPIRMKPAEFARNVHVAVAHESNVPDDLSAPHYWAHVSTQLRPWELIEVRADNGLWWAEVLVLEAGRNYARVHVLRVIDLSKSAVKSADTIQIGGYEISFRGEFAKWSVIRQGDRAVVRDQLGTQGEAVNWVNERLKAET